MKKRLCLLPLAFIILTVQAYATARPFPNDNLEHTETTCDKLAQKSKSEGVKTLVIAFEGLAAYKKKAAKRFYSYLDELKSGENKSPAKKTRMAFVTDNLLIKNAARNYKDIEYVILPHSGQGKKDTVAFTCLKSWSKVYNNQLKVVLVGHSFGGNAAKRLMNTASEYLPKLKIKGMLSIDPRLKANFVTAPNIEKHYVYYQKGFLRGYPYKDPRGKGFTFNTRVRGKDISGPEANNHANLTLYSGVQRRYLELLK